jgi:hypothetical protein
VNFVEVLPTSGAKRKTAPVFRWTSKHPYPVVSRIKGQDESEVFRFADFGAHMRPCWHKFLPVAAYFPFPKYATQANVVPQGVQSQNAQNGV